MAHYYFLYPSKLKPQVNYIIIMAEKINEIHYDMIHCFSQLIKCRTCTYHG
jgi:hypothetical protein